MMLIDCVWLECIASVVNEWKFDIYEYVVVMMWQGEAIIRINDFVEYICFLCLMMLQSLID